MLQHRIDKHVLFSTCRVLHLLGAGLGFWSVGHCDGHGATGRHCHHFGAAVDEEAHAL